MPPNGHVHDASCTDHVHDNSAPRPVSTFTTAHPIDAASLRAKQAPIKQAYRDDPSSALITLRSSGTLSATSVACKLSTGAAVRDAKERVAGLHPAAGGPDAQLSGELCSGDMLLEALVACAGVTLKAVATALGIAIIDGEVRAEGDLDFRGTLGIDREAPVGFKAIRLGFEIRTETEVAEETVEKLGKLTERYCVVLQTIVKKPQLSVVLKQSSESEDGIERGNGWGQKL